MATTLSALPPRPSAAASSGKRVTAFHRGPAPVGGGLVAAPPPGMSIDEKTDSEEVPLLAAAAPSAVGPSMTSKPPVAASSGVPQTVCTSAATASTGTMTSSIGGGVHATATGGVRHGHAPPQSSTSLTTTAPAPGIDRALRGQFPIPQQQAHVLQHSSGVAQYSHPPRSAALPPALSGTFRQGPPVFGSRAVASAPSVRSPLSAETPTASATCASVHSSMSGGTPVARQRQENALRLYAVNFVNTFYNKLIQTPSQLARIYSRDASVDRVKPREYIEESCSSVFHGVVFDDAMADDKADASEEHLSDRFFTAEAPPATVSGATPSAGPLAASAAARRRRTTNSGQVKHVNIDYIDYQYTGTRSILVSVHGDMTMGSEVTRPFHQVFVITHSSGSHWELDNDILRFTDDLKDKERLRLSQEKMQRLQRLKDETAAKLRSQEEELEMEQRMTPTTGPVPARHCPPSVAGAERGREHERRDVEHGRKRPMYTGPPPSYGPSGGAPHGPGPRYQRHAPHHAHHRAGGGGPHPHPHPHPHAHGPPGVSHPSAGGPPRAGGYPPSTVPSSSSPYGARAAGGFPMPGTRPPHTGAPPPGVVVAGSSGADPSGHAPSGRPPRRGPPGGGRHYSGAGHHHFGGPPPSSGPMPSGGPVVVHSRGERDSSAPTGAEHHSHPSGPGSVGGRVGGYRGSAGGGYHSDQRSDSSYSTHSPVLENACFMSRLPPAMNGAELTSLILNTLRKEFGERSPEGAEWRLNRVDLIGHKLIAFIYFGNTPSFDAALKLGTFYTKSGGALYIQRKRSMPRKAPMQPSIGSRDMGPKRPPRVPPSYASTGSVPNLGSSTGGRSEKAASGGGPLRGGPLAAKRKSHRK